jgi:mannose-6-phosphate isomerase-like protein (cupin superfamily)
MTALAATGARPALLPPREHENLLRLEAKLLELPQVEMPVTHEHCDGLYARTIKIPAGVVLTGKPHRHECFFVVRRGRIAVTKGDRVVLLEQGDMLVTPAGSMRAGVALTDVEVTTFHPNPGNERDPQALWDQYVIPTPARALGAQPVAVN